VPLTLIGILQYIAPTMHLLLGVFVFGEPFAPTQLVGFAVVWLALLVFGLDGLTRRVTRRGSDPLHRATQGV
jgi:chloramphenicol-sensitive protein RarD